MRKTFRKRYKSRNHLLGDLWYGDYVLKHWWEIRLKRLELLMDDYLLDWDEAVCELDQGEIYGEHTN